MEGVVSVVRVNGIEYPVRRIPFDGDTAVKAIEAQLLRLREERVAGSNIGNYVAALKIWISEVGCEFAKNNPEGMFVQLTQQDRMKFCSGRNRMRELNNQLRDIQNFHSDNSAEQAAFLTGATGKYANKALRRAQVRNNDDPDSRFEKLINNVKEVGEALPQALRADALEQLQCIQKTRGRPVIENALQAMAGTPMAASELDMALDLARQEELLHSVADGDQGSRELLDQKVPALLEQIEPSESSYLSLLTQRQQLSEWAESSGDIEKRVTDEFDTIAYVGTLGLPVKVHRFNATQVDPFAARVSKVLPSPVDSCSLACARSVEASVASPEGISVEDMLWLIDPDCPRASKLAYWSGLGDTFTSMTVCRDLFMYLGPQQRVALHAHALLCLIGSNGNSDDKKDDVGKLMLTSTVKLALRVLYSIRSHWGEACNNGTYVELLRQMLSLGSLNEAAGVASPVQLLLALSALDWTLATPKPEAGVEEIMDEADPLSVPVRLQLYNEVLSRAARAWLRKKTGSSEHSVTLKCAYKLLRNTLGITVDSAPLTRNIFQDEPGIEEARKNCRSDFSLDSATDPRPCTTVEAEPEEGAGMAMEVDTPTAAVDADDILQIDNWVSKELQQARRVVYFACELRREIAELGGWRQLMELIEAKGAESLAKRLAESMSKMPSLAEELQLPQADLSVLWPRWSCRLSCIMSVVIARKCLMMCVIARRSGRWWSSSVCRCIGQHSLRKGKKSRAVPISACMSRQYICLLSNLQLSLMRNSVSIKSSVGTDLMARSMKIN